jgi:hypothetical protein
MSREFYVIPTIGQFKVTVTTNYDFYDKHKINHYILNIGGNYDKCVNITIHPQDSQKSKELILSWAEVLGKECTTNSQIIKGDATVKMVELAFNIAKEIAPYSEYATLKDMSYFYCNTPDGKKKVALSPYYIAFNDKTWYEDKFKAVLSNDLDYKKYRECIQSIYNNDAKPSYFEFGNNTIKDILLPLYLEATSWKDFFKSIDKTFPNDKCVLMYPWIDNAISSIFKSCGSDDLYIGKEWTINLKNIQKVHYYELDKSIAKYGGYTHNYTNQYDNYRNLDYNDILYWNLSSFLKKKNNKKTRKNSINGLKSYTKKKYNTLEF